MEKSFMKHNNDGFYDLTNFNGEWAQEVSQFAEYLREVGTSTYRDQTKNSYTLEKHETFYERKKGSLSLFDDSAWVRFNRVYPNAYSNGAYYIDYRKNIDAKIVKKKCGEKPKLFQIENETKEFGGLEPIVENECTEYHFLFEKPSDENPAVGAVVDLVVKINKFETKYGKKTVVYYILKDKTEFFYGEEVSIQMKKDVATMYRLFRRTMREACKRTLITNPYQDAVWICSDGNQESLPID